MRRLVCALCLAMVPAASAQPPDREAERHAGLFDHEFSEMRFRMGWASATDKAVRQMLEAGMETGKGSIVCELATDSLRLHAQLKGYATRLGKRPEQSHLSPEWIRSRLAELPEWETRARAQHEKSCG